MWQKRVVESPAQSRPVPRYSERFGDTQPRHCSNREIHEGWRLVLVARLLTKVETFAARRVSSLTHEDRRLINQGSRVCSQTIMG